MVGEGRKRLFSASQYSGVREQNLHDEQRRDGADQRNDQSLNVAEAPALQEQNQQHIRAGNQHAVEERNVEEQVERNRRADDLGQIAGGDGDLGADPERKADSRP